ncbi:uncharacterized protein [Euwallacea fornicatus]|uniref:uncharacterized protein n=1 Tax=Euwallacea fornicatus TaxID=995702 RepID=UPI00338EBF8F
MAKILCLLALAAFVQFAYSLECYTCDPITCAQESSKWGKVPGCGKTTNNDRLAGACLKQVFTDNNKKEVTIRKCVIANKDESGKLSFECKDGTSRVCEVCSQDLCNSAPAVSFSFVTVLGAIAVFLIPKYFL